MKFLLNMRTENTNTLKDNKVFKQMTYMEKNKVKVIL